jgi:hypothetical protein
MKAWQPMADKEFFNKIESSNRKDFTSGSNFFTAFALKK